MGEIIIATEDTNRVLIGQFPDNKWILHWNSTYEDQILKFVACSLTEDSSSKFGPSTFRINSNGDPLLICWLRGVKSLATHHSDPSSSPSWHLCCMSFSICAPLSISISCHLLIISSLTSVFLYAHCVPDATFCHNRINYAAFICPLTWGSAYACWSKST